jgi:hypothetical protein
MNKEQMEYHLFRWFNSTTRLNGFLEFASELTPSLYWYGLALAYTCSDNLCTLREESKRCFSSDLPNRECLMNEDELLVFRSLPEMVTIYRGMTEEEKESGDYSISWTLKKEVAKFFATKYNRNYSERGKKKTIVKLRVPKTNLVAYFNDRKEEEVIYLHPIKK